jgi:hypothetical protein
VRGCAFVRVCGGLSVGEIKHEHKLIKAVTATFPEDHVGSLDAHPSVDGIEKDQEVHIQA